MSIGNYAENKILDKVFRNTDFTVTTPYLSLHTDDPGETGANEVTGGSYARQAATFDAAANGATANSGAINFTSMPGVTVTHVGLWDASSNGNFLWGGAATASKVVNAGDTYQVGAGDLDITLN